jgi:Rap1a immunity proteins
MRIDVTAENVLHGRVEIGGGAAMRWILGLLAIAVSVSSAAAQQDINSANFMLPHCKGFLSRQQSPTSPSDAFEQGVCAGTITAFAFVARVLPVQMRYCYPDGVTPSQMIPVVIKYIEARPARLHESFRELALEALRDAWPCR